MINPTNIGKSAAALVILLASIIALSSPAIASDWKAYGTAKYYDYEYDAESITWQSEETVRAWTKDMVRDNEGVRYIIQERLKREIATEVYDSYLYTSHYIEFQCSSRKNRLLAMYDYNKDGVVLYSEEFPHSDFTSIVPDSQADELRKIVCLVPQR